VNAHCHFELSTIERPSPRPFVDWVKYLLAQGPPNYVPAYQVEACLQCFLFGITTTGDITTIPRQLRPLFARIPRVVSFGEVRAMATRRGLLDERVAAAVEGHTAIGISPHAPYSIEPEGYRRCLQEASQRNLPITTHLAETPDEAEFLARHSGPLREIWDFLGGWDDHVPTFQGGPIRFAREMGLLDYAKSSLAHVNYCDDDELDILANGKASVVYCPRTHQYFAHPPHRWQEMLNRGINVAVGTDSCASSPNLNLVDDLRLLHQIAPAVPAEALWKMGTLNGARAIGADDQLGSLTCGKRADFVIFDARGKDALQGILEEAKIPRAVWIGGEPIE
jgi:cytosine/adenosine deaminase-related metal-dependent hydrolase